MKISWCCFGLLLMIVVFGCNHQQNQSHYLIIVGSNASTAEKLAASDLKADLEKVTDKPVTIIQENEKFTGESVNYVIGTPFSNSLITSLIDEKSIRLSEDFPGPRGGIWDKSQIDGVEVIVLAGSDIQGTQYAVYDYSHEVLGIDPFYYWTGKEPEKNRVDPLNFKERIITPPRVPILCYFENDVDELANLKEPLLEYDWESYTEMIDALVRIRYNAIHLFDMLGRPEFFIRPAYKAIRPDYDIDIDYIEKMIDYAHDKGMMVQIDMALGYKINPISEDKASCWSEYKDTWIATWNYYFEKTPLGKADIFALRPRNQVWDWEYKSSCDEDKVEVFNEVYEAFGKVIDRHNREAKKLVICYADGMEMFNNGFNPPKDFIIAWSDDGWAGFEYLPEDTKGYEFGTYMHAGFWLNHTVHDPYPEKIDSTMNMMFDRYQADRYCMVNGQQFRPFLLNLEALSEVSMAPDDYDGEKFYQNWTERYFDKSVANLAVQAMKLLHETQFDNKGYVEHLWEIREAISYLSNSPIERPGKTPVSYDYGRVENDLEHVKSRMVTISRALEIAGKGLNNVADQDTFYYDYVYLPILLYYDLLYFESILHKMALVKREFELTQKESLLEQARKLLADSRSQLDTLYKHRIDGDKNPKWETWYDPEKRRPNNGFPTTEMLNTIEEAMVTTWNSNQDKAND
ncbi:glycosyl hydrolase 115 family protein [Fulvivirgaceae bacterium BMA10]|uniref:Glycosyl hydrolase 115 family protein n=1 Tax=Splendidivirga corallicola TaxID=3051826 RepID=A0ABT8KZ61_9BACT|nr:glycosyl hydrolase 115 family protein [Fulvivirgaceae bacterium BMA10]